MTICKKCGINIKNMTRHIQKKRCSLQHLRHDHKGENGAKQINWQKSKVAK